MKRLFWVAWVFASCTDQNIVAPDAETAARIVLAQPNDLRVTSVRRSLTGEHVRFERLAPDGTPVADVEVSVHLGGAAPRYQLQRVLLPPLLPLSLVGTRRITEADARSRARAAVGAGQDLASSAIALPQGDREVRPGWRVLVRTDTALWEVWVDASSGMARVRRDLLQHVDGTGYVYRPNPVTSSGDVTLRDNANATSPALDAARVMVTLQALDGTGVLRGPYADVTQGNANMRAQSPTNQFLFDRSQSGFEETNAYFHIDHANRNLQTLGFTGPMAILARPLHAFVNDGNLDNSNYDPSTQTLHFGAGGVDDAEDGDVVMHEYGHAVLDFIIPGFGANGDAGAMGEGFGDTLAASTPTGGPDAVTRACVAPWDATAYSTTNPPCLRRVDGQKHYPEFLDGEVHDDGEIWSGAMWQMYTDTGLGPSEGLKLVVEAVFSVSPDTTYPAYAQAVLDADQALYNGVHQDAIKHAFWSHGIYLTTLAPAPFVGTIQTASANVASPSPIPNLTDQSRTITHPGAQAIRVHFASFAMQTSSRCLNNLCDAVYLYDGAGRLYARLGGAMGAFNGPPIAGDTVIVRWVTDDATTSTGFTIDHYDYLGSPPPADGGASDGPMASDGPTSEAGAPDASADAQPGDGSSGQPDGASGQPDAGSPSKSTEDGGCGCRVGDGGAPSPLWMVLVVVGLALRRRF